VIFGTLDFEALKIQLSKGNFLHDKETLEVSVGGKLVFLKDNVLTVLKDGMVVENIVLKKDQLKEINNITCMLGICLLF